MGEPGVGARLGKYELLSQLGRGGMAVVFKVKDTETGMERALKIMTGGDKPGAHRRQARFRREVRAVQSLDHPNLVKIYDAGKSGPLDFYVMDLITGGDFEKALEEKDRLDVPTRLEIVEGICKAMAHAHERGVIHRDLKPQNVLLEGLKPKVVDFGLAKVEDEVSLTRTNTALGTPFYMAPEQHKNAKGIDQRADVFALGVIIYQCVTGQRPFMGETMAEIGHKVLTWDPPLPSKVTPQRSNPSIDAIVAKALEKDPARRYLSAGLLLADLVRARAGKEITGAKGAIGFRADARKWLEKNRAAVIGGAIVGLVFLPIVGFLAIRGNGPAPRPPVVTKNDKKPEDPKDPKGGDKKPDPKPTDPKTRSRRTRRRRDPKATDPDEAEGPEARGPEAASRRTATTPSPRSPSLRSPRRRLRSRAPRSPTRTSRRRAARRWSRRRGARRPTATGSSSPSSATT